MESYRILLPHQLFPREVIPEPKERVIVADHLWLLEELPLNKTTLFHRIVSAGAYAKEHSFQRMGVLDTKGYSFLSVCRRIRREGAKELRMFDPLDAPLRRDIEIQCKKVGGLQLVFEDTPAFTETHEDLDRFLKEHPPGFKGGIHRYSHAVFYQWQRRRLDLLMTPAGAPVGGKWSFDTENREPFPQGLTRDPPGAPGGGAGVKGRVGDKAGGRKGEDGLMTLATKAVEWIQREHPTNPGVLPETPTEALRMIGGIFPLTRKQALTRLRQFMRKTLPNFGAYEDAFKVGVSFGYHSVLSSSLNNGLLVPDDVITEIRRISPKRLKNRRFLASLEGFVRQVFGWRAYVRLVYREERTMMLRSNFLGHRRRLPRTWFQGEHPPSTRMGFLDALLKDAYRLGYAHHIVRLMVFSNWFLLTGVHPRDVLRWFSSVVSIDAYEWVMVPNVLGMGQFADGGSMMQRPYISASAYLEKMSGGGIGDDFQEIWDALYYAFLMRHRKKLGKTYAYSRSYAYMKKVDSAKIREWKRVAEEYLRLIYSKP